MVSRKYTGDYRLENITDRRGRIRTVPVYRGDWYSFCESAETVRRTKRLCCILSALCLAMFLPVLFVNAPCGHVMYITLPFAALIIPIYFLLAGCARLLTAKDRVTREHSDKILPRITGSALSAMLLSGISCGGHIFYAIRTGDTAPDLLCFAATAVILAASIILFSRRGRLRMEVSGAAKRESETM